MISWSDRDRCGARDGACCLHVVWIHFAYLLNSAALIPPGAWVVCHVWDTRGAVAVVVWCRVCYPSCIRHPITRYPGILQSGMGI